MDEKHKGFTIIEFVIVIIIISILAIQVYSNWSGMVVNVGAQAAQLANDIRYTQSLSMNKGERYSLIRRSANSYQIINAAGTAIILAMGQTTITLGSGITFSSFTNLPNNLIAFNGKGVPYVDTTSPGTPLATTASIVLSASGNTKSVFITPETGRVVVS